MLSQIVFIYRDQFVCGVVEKLLKENSVACYATSDVNENIAYILDDVRPQLVVVDEETLKREGSQVMASLKDAKGEFKTVLLANSAEPSGKFDFTLCLPLDIQTFYEDLRSLVENPQ